MSARVRQGTTRDDATFGCAHVGKALLGLWISFELQPFNEFNDPKSGLNASFFVDKKHQP